MGNSIVGDGILERFRDVALADYFLKALRSPLSGQNQIGHQPTSTNSGGYPLVLHSSKSREISEKVALHCK
jgi:hypothetical protein